MRDLNKRESEASWSWQKGEGVLPHFKLLVRMNEEKGPVLSYKALDHHPTPTFQLFRFHFHKVFSTTLLIIHFKINM